MTKDQFKYEVVKEMSTMKYIMKDSWIIAAIASVAFKNNLKTEDYLDTLEPIKEALTILYS